MRLDRRIFVKKLGLAGVAAATGAAGCAAGPGTGAGRRRRGGGGAALPGPADAVKPPRLRPGDTVGLVNPSGATYVEDDVVVVEERLRALDLEPVRGEHVLARHGYLAGTDEERAADLNRMFGDDAIDAVLAVRGGWGAARLLPRIDFDAVRASPKVFMGYSDITALLLSLHARTGLVTFHGPVGSSAWNDFTVRWVREILFDAGTPTLVNPEGGGDDLVPTAHRAWTITPGTARGRLVGGNLTVLTAIVGSGHLPDFDGAILFLEDIGEDIYRVDRMLTQLSLAGILDAVAGVVWGRCTDCDPGGGYGSLTLPELLEGHLASRGVPAWRGAAIGHIGPKWTVPVGVEAEMDADAGTLRLVEPAVT